MEIVKFIYAKNKSEFENRKNKISQESVVFIEDTKQIWTHGQYYAWSENELQQLFGDKITNLENIIITNGNGDSYLSDDGTYHKLSIDLSKYLKKSEAQDTYLTIDDAVNMFQEKDNYITSIPVANGTTLGGVCSGGNVIITNGIIIVEDDSHNHVINNIDNLQTSLDEKVSQSIKINGKSLTSDITLTASDIKAEKEGTSENALAEAKKYTDDSIANLVGQAPEAMDTIYELAEAMESNQSIIDIVNEAIGSKVDKEDGKGLSSNDYTTSDKIKMDSIKENAEENQNAFSNILINSGQQLIAADNKTDSFNLVAGKNITLGVNGKNITISGQANSVVNGDPTLSWGAKSVVGSIDDIALTVTMPSNPNTHYDTSIRVGTSGTTTNNSENNPYLKILDNNTYKSQVQLMGDGGTTVSSDDLGKITVWSKTYKTASYIEDGLMTKEDKYKLDYIEEGAQANTVLGVKGDSETVYRAGNINITKSNIGLGNVDNTSDANKPVSNATQTELNKKAPLDNPTFTGIPVAPTATVGTNTTQIATTAFVQKEISEKLAVSDAMVYKGTIGAKGTISTLPDIHEVGWTYKVITAGTYAGMICEVGDMIICLTEGNSANNTHWTVVQNNIDGIITGPSNSGDAHVAIFDGDTGKVIKDSGFTIGTSVPQNAIFTDTTYELATTDKEGLMSKEDKTLLQSLSSQSSTVSFTPAYTSGTKIGTITINGVSTDIYIPIWTGTLAQYNELTKQNEFIYNIIE